MSMTASSVSWAAISCIACVTVPPLLFAGRNMHFRSEPLRILAALHPRKIRSDFSQPTLHAGWPRCGRVWGAVDSGGVRCGSSRNQWRRGRSYGDEVDPMTEWCDDGGFGRNRWRCGAVRACGSGWRFFGVTVGLRTSAAWTSTLVMYIWGTKANFLSHHAKF